MRQLRLAAGMSIAKLAERVHYSKSHLSKIERGEKRPNVEIARRCDAVLGSGRTLAALLEADNPALPAAPGYSEALIASGEGMLPMAAASGWVIRLGPDGSGQFVVPGHTGREFLDNPALMSWAPVAATKGSAAMLGGTIDGLRTMARSMSPAVIFPVLVGTLQAIRIEAAGATGERWARLMSLLGLGTELAGWLAQELGDHHMSTWWTDQATEIASLVGDDDLWAYSLIRKSLMALYKRNHGLAIGLASAAASRAGTSPRTGWLAAQRLAQAHALAGDATLSLRAADRAATMLPTLENPAVDDANLTQLVRGWCLYELGFLDQAIEVFDREVPKIGPDAIRSTARFSIRQALAHASAGNVEQSCHIVQGIVGDVTMVDSATIRSDLHLLTHGLHRWNQRPQVASVQAHLNAAMQGRLYP
ncbi:transcriptional regulator [Dactylosporangium sucinum]|uniref:Transcriptional regulator n=1 Tax=Dactylosporangium sucinum TaxID=1424081 RepID=A0A917U0A9_9ACTN|nr:transcriptional regulator [Dactylosporangium sucinum]